VNVYEKAVSHKGCEELSVSNLRLQIFDAGMVTSVLSRLMAVFTDSDVIAAVAKE